MRKLFRCSSVGEENRNDVEQNKPISTNVFIIIILFSTLTVILIFEIRRSKLINSKIFWDHTLGVRSIFLFLSIEVKGQANNSTRTISSIENPPQRL